MTRQIGTPHGRLGVLAREPSPVSPEITSLTCIFALITLFFIVFAPHFASLATASAMLRITAIVSRHGDRHDFCHRLRRRSIFRSVRSRASSSMMTALLLERDVPTFAPPLIVLAMGALDRGGLRPPCHQVRIPSFLVTLGMLSIFSGLALTVTDTSRPNS